MNLLSAAYAAVARARRARYERDPGRRHRLQRPVISVGSVSVGGSGKTPAAADVARVLLAAGERPAILTRGYRRRQPTDGALVVSDGSRVRADVARAGDEPLMLARALPGVAVLVGADRYLSGVLAERRLGCTVHVLDDGFQHVRLHRDIDIVLVAPGDLHDRVLPAGRLREDTAALKRADAIVVNEPGTAEVAAIVQQTGVEAAFTADVRLAPPAATENPSGAVFAVAGIARPRRFFDMLSAAGYSMAGQMAFRDHHWYTRTDLGRIVDAARRAGGCMIVTTEKDLVRLLPYRPFPVPIVAARLEFHVGPVPEFRAWLLARLEAARRAVPLEQPA